MQAGRGRDGAARREADPSSAVLPFRPRSMRAFMLWEQHVIDSSRMLVKNFFPAPWRRSSLGFERVTGRTFPKLKPNDRFREAPTFYVANHTSVLADGEDMWWPSHTKYLDFELELACVLREAARRRDAGGGDRRGGRLVRLERLERARRPGRRRAAQHLRPRRQVEDVRQFDRLRRRDRGRGAGLDRDARPRARRRRALVRGHDGESAAHARRDARLRVRRREARRG